VEIKPFATYVRITYTVRLESGEILKGDPRTGLEDLGFVTGFNQVLPGLERRLIGLRYGDQAVFVVPAEEAFGVYDPSLVKKRKLTEFPEGASLTAGTWMVAQNDEYRITCGYYVKEKNPQSIVLDYNHPLAGKALHYQFEIVEVRPVTPEELEILRPCGFEPGSQSDVVNITLGAE
jgi:FKBP-type peptidyl-prolyl cis-trans isomerase SlyD